MDKRISSPFSQALYAVEVLTERIKSLSRNGSVAGDSDQDQGEDSYRLLSWRNSLHEPLRNRTSDDGENHSEESPPPYEDDDSPTVTPISPNFPLDNNDTNNHGGNSRSGCRRRRFRFGLDLWIITIILIAIGNLGVWFLIFPFPTTIPAFISLMIILIGWTNLTWIKTLYHTSILLKKIDENSFEDKKRIASRRYFDKFSTTKRTILLSSTCFLLYLCYLGLIIPEEQIPPVRLNQYHYGVPEKYFIAANLHDNEDILPTWSSELVKLVNYLGNDNVFISIYESNSHDSTKKMLSNLNSTLAEMGVGKSIITEQDDKHWWPYSTSPERIGYLANARNKALLPIQSSDPLVRLGNYQDFTKIIFLNDVFFNYKSILNLINTNDGNYDQACALDFGTSGLYDTWASRDICGIPLRPFWPYVKDQVTISKLQKEEPFEVSSCWNGAVVFKSDPFLYKPSNNQEDAVEEESMFEDNGFSQGGKHLGKRGWKMVDDPTYTNSVFSPALTLPIQFRTSNISACDHSECFLIGYDLHRLYDTVERPPMIYMNPNVKLAYEKNWFVWHNKVLRIPVIQWWLENWSRGYPFYFVDWIWENAGRRRDYCTWSALSIHLPERCPALPGAVNKQWDQ
ncbi:uncharacterized protein L201_000871 [Kwoniella dendrophila CBS 6074]|uniref:Capsular associated protein n=1 Tax=Kwoniella dendrophila CBS 6074 TaxID=1295534 RepID=A0AAX4JN82_9TREE